MSQMKSVFVVIVIIFSGRSSAQTQNKLTKQICNKTSLNVDSVVRPFGTDFVYLFTGNLVFKLKLQIDGTAVINSSQKLEDWDQKIRGPINMVYATKKNPNYLILKNCAMKKEWRIRYIDNYFKGSFDSTDCGKAIEYVLDSQTGDQYILKYYPDRDDLVITHWSIRNFDWLLASLVDEPNSINAIRIYPGKGYDPGTKSFSKLNQKLITAAFIHKEYWYLFGGRYYCKVKLNSFEECKPQPISDWIHDCNPKWQELHSNPHKSADISLYVIIVVAIIAFAVVALILIIVLTMREYRKRGTYLNKSSAYNTSI